MTYNTFARWALLCAAACLAQPSHAAQLTGSVVQWGDEVVPSIPPEMRFRSIASGYQAAFALSTDGVLYGWRWNYYREIPALNQASNIIAISAYAHTLALRSDGTVLAWGRNQEGQRNVPSGLSNVVAVSAGGHHSLALKSDGTVVAWGWNFCGQTNVPAGLSNIIAVAAGACNSFLLKSDGTVLYLGNHTNAIVGGLSNVVAIAVSAGSFGGSLWTVHSDGSLVRSWLSAPAVFTNTVVAGLTNVSAVSAGEGVLALQSDGTVFYFGESQPLLAGATGVATGGGGLFALLADGNVVHFHGLVPQPPLWAKTRDVTAIAGDSLALRQDGTVLSWGPIADSETAPSLSNVIAIARGYEHSMALKAGGTVVAWGWNADGQTNVPAGLSNVTAIAAGGYHSLALKADGSIVGWGYNSYGQAVNRSIGAAEISAGALHSLALLSNGTVEVWGGLSPRPVRRRCSRRA